MKFSKKFSLKSNQGGFSLVELMIVVGIIGVLATLAMPRFRQFQAKAKMAEAKNNLTHIFTLQQSYHLDQNIYEPFALYGRLANGTVNCNNAPEGARDIGFEINPCTVNGAPVPRYGYLVQNTNRATFDAQALTGNGNNNLVCPGAPGHGFEMNQVKVLTDDVQNGPAMRSCFQ